MREVRPRHPDGTPIILVHGARVPGLASFDLPCANGSLAEDLAMAGHVVYVMDARGYGRSTKPSEMSGDPHACRPLVRSSEVIRDLTAILSEARRRTRSEPAALFGWATGAMWAGHYASLHPELISHVIFYNSLYGGSAGHPLLGPGSGMEDPNHPGRFNAASVGGFSLNAAENLLRAWNESIPTPDAESWRDPAVARAYVEAALESDDTSGSRDPPSFRAPTGALEDSYYLACGRQLWDASFVTSRAMVIRSELDFWSRPEDAEVLADHLVHAAEVVRLVIPRGTHYVHLDRPEAGRDRFLKEVQTFLAA